MISRIDELILLHKEDPNDPFLLYAIGLEYLSRSNYELAISYFNQTILKQPRYTAAYYQLGKIFIELDITDVAKKYILEGIQSAQLEKNFKAVTELNQLLDEIK